MRRHHTDFVWAADPTVSLSVCGEGSTAIIVLPGGGYNTCSPTESDPVAEFCSDIFDRCRSILDRVMENSR